jgi:hypothetical protein
MKNFSIDLSAMTRPTRPEHILAMLKEASMELDNLSANLDTLTADCEKAARESTCA